MSEEADVLLDGEEETGLQEVNMQISDIGAFTFFKFWPLAPPPPCFLT